MADLNPNLILLQRPLPSPQDMANERQLRQVQQQELTLRAQEIAQRGEALRQQAMQRSQRAAAPGPKEQMEAAQYQIFQAEQVADTLKRVQANPDLYPLAKQHIGQIFGPDVAAHLPETYDPDQVNAMIATGEKAVAQAKANLVPVDTVNESGAPVRRFVTPTEGLEVPLVQKPTAAEKPPNIGSFEDYVARYAQGKNKPVAQLTTADIEDARKRYQQADDRPRITVNTPNVEAGNVAETVKGMKDGTLPPLLPGRASKDYIAILSEAHRQGYDLAAAATDWAATQKHIATMNGSQQLRLNQSINALPELLDSVAQLSDKWKGGRFPALNKANLFAATNGAYGSEVASVANQLYSQIADVVADLGNVYMGGNSPTDHALELAGKSLKAEWDAKVLKDMVGLAKKNVQIRRNSINNTGVAGASADNPYAPPAPVVTPKFRFNPATGKVEAIP